MKRGCERGAPSSRDADELEDGLFARTDAAMGLVALGPQRAYPGVAGRVEVFPDLGPPPGAGTSLTAALAAPAVS